MLTSSANCEIYRVLNKDTGEIERLKVMLINFIPHEAVERYIHTVELICSFKDSQIVKYHDYNENDEHLVEFMKEFPSSLAFINPISYFHEIGPSSAIKEICTNLLKLHESNIIHSNIKPSNILISEDNHFYLSDYCKNTLYTTVPNLFPLQNESVKFLSPEIISNYEIKKETDIWSIGIIIYYLFTGKLPFDGKTIYETENHIMGVNYNKFGLSEKITNLLSKLLNRKCENRMKINDLINEIDNIKDIIPFTPSIIIEDLPLPDFDKLLDKKISGIINKEINNINENKLESVFLAGKDIGDIGLKYFCSKLSTLTFLKSLNLTDNSITDDGVKYLSNNFKYLNDLKALYLQGNEISDDGFSYMSEQIYKCSKLTSLSLSDNNVKDCEKIETKIQSCHPNAKLSIYM